MMLMTKDVTNFNEDITEDKWKTSNSYDNMNIFVGLSSLLHQNSDQSLYIYN